MKKLWMLFLFLSSCTPAYTSFQKDTRFETVMKTIIRHEGGLSNDKNDPGMVTKYGISLRFLRSEHLDPNGDNKIDDKDIINLTLTEADYIYYREWYTRYHYDAISNTKVLTKIMDFSVNSGASQAHKLIKRALNRILVNQIPVNGELDKTTLVLINSIYPSVFCEALVREELRFYEEIIQRNSALTVFKRGWDARAMDIKC